MVRAKMQFDAMLFVGSSKWAKTFGGPMNAGIYNLLATDSEVCWFNVAGCVEPQSKELEIKIHVTTQSCCNHQYVSCF